MNKHVVSRWENDQEGVRHEQWMFLYTKTRVETVEAKVFPEHGDIVNRGMAGGGYHGNCSQCGLALVTDLGYMSWEGTTCEVKGKTEVITDYTVGWTKFPKRARVMEYKDAYDWFNTVKGRQGWGRYNFSITNSKEHEQLHYPINTEIQG